MKLRREVAESAEITRDLVRQLRSMDETAARTHELIARCRETMKKADHVLKQR